MESAQSSGVTQQDGKGVFNKVLATLVDAAADPNSFANDGDRIQALMAAYTLISRLETPWETVLRLVMGQVNTHPMLCFDLTCHRGEELWLTHLTHGNTAALGCDSQGDQRSPTLGKVARPWQRGLNTREAGRASVL